MNKRWNIESPISVHVEITEACNEKCKHCYNFYRDSDYIPKTISMENIEKTVNELVKNNVLHVIITGGEPLLAIKEALYLIKLCKKNNMTVSLNSNLLAATPEKMKKLKEAGLQHILTTLFSHKSTVHDYMSSTKGSFKKILNGIEVTRDAGIRVSVNLILTKHNKNDVYPLGKLLHNMGINKLLANRLIPSPTNFETYKDKFLVGPSEVEKMFKDLIRLETDFGMEIGTCRTVPICFFDDINEALKFLPRGCAAGRKHMSLNVNGESHACVHELKSYGNIHEIGIKGVWNNMKKWRSNEYIPDECINCPLFELCDSGCRMVALCHTKKMNGIDNLRKGLDLIINPSMTYRIEKDYYLMRTIGAKVTYVPNKDAKHMLSNELHKINPYTIIRYMKDGLLVRKK